MADEFSYAYTLRLMHDGRKYFGPGVARLLRLVQERGSLSKAARAMGMAYSKAWNIVVHAEEVLGFDLLDSRAGGRAGGGGTVTERGLAFLDRYEAYAARLKAEADALYAECWGDLGQQPVAGEN